MFSRSLRPLLSLLVLGSGWRLYFYYDHSLWARLVEGTGNRPDVAWLVFVVALYAMTYVGLLFIRDANAKLLMTVSLAAALVLSTGILLAPALQSWYVAFALLGAAAGVLNAGVVYYGSAGVPPESRVPIVAFVVLGFTLIVYALGWAARSWGVDITFIFAAALLVGALVVNGGYRPAVVAPSTETDALPFPTKLVVANGITIFVGYFGNYLNQSGTGTQDMQLGDPLYAWIGLLVRVVVCVFFLIAGRRIKIVSILYVCQASTVLAFAMSMTGSTPAAWVLYNITNIVGTIALYALISAVAYKYLRRPQTFALLLLLTGAGIVFGYLAGTAVQRYLSADPLFFRVVPLVIFCACFFVLPFALRSIAREVDLDRSSSPGFLFDGDPSRAEGPAWKESDVIRFRQRIADSIDALNGTFDKEYRLTARESEIASYLAERYDYETIADKLLISVNTLKVHIRSIYRKYDISNRKSLIELIEQKTGSRAAG